MNLYWVDENDAEWGVYVFAHNGNKARQMYKNFGGWHEYIDSRVRLIGKTDEVEQETLVDDELHPLYPIVIKLGGGFTDIEEDQESEK
jgi:hypothetical protein